VNRTPRAGAAERFSYLNRPENLKALFETIHHLIYVKKDARSAAALFSYLRPNEERVKKALRSDIHPKNLEIILDWYRGGGSTTVAGIIQLVKPEQTIVKVHGATTEEIARYRQGTMQQDMMLYSGFPGGAVLMATRYLRWGMTFYEVELLEPGKEHGVKYHLFYWDGKQWTMLGGVWKALE
jgi:hypothetical protein